MERGRRTRISALDFLSPTQSLERGGKGVPRQTSTFTAEGEGGSKPSLIIPIRVGERRGKAKPPRTSLPRSKERESYFITQGCRERKSTEFHNITPTLREKEKKGREKIRIDEGRGPTRTMSPASSLHAEQSKGKGRKKKLALNLDGERGKRRPTSHRSSRSFTLPRADDLKKKEKKKGTPYSVGISV